MDVDGNRYVDYVCSWGPLIHGHAHPQILEAVHAAAERGTSFGAPTAGEVELAEEVARRMPGVDMLRMTSSGTEATMTALRLARAVTWSRADRKVRGCLPRARGRVARAGRLGPRHAGDPREPGGARERGGVPPWWCRGTTPRRWWRRCDRHEPAAILAEPIPANMGLVPPRAGFLELLREQADASGALLVLDEVISGFRVARGGAQELTGVHGDLTIMGKVLGGGLPAAAVGGRAELMELLAPAGEVYQAGTLSGNPLAVAAGIATLQLLDESAYARLAGITEQLAAGLREAASERAPERPIQIATLPGLLTVFFSERPVRDLEGAQACDLQAHAAWCRGLLARGVYPPPSQFEAWFPSLAHTAEQIERTVVAAAAAFGELQ